LTSGNPFPIIKIIVEVNPMKAINDHMSKETRVFNTNVSATYYNYKLACKKTRQKLPKNPENHNHIPGQVAGRTSITKSIPLNIDSPEFFKETSSSKKRTSAYTSATIQLPPKMPDNKNVSGIFFIFTSKNYYRNLQMPV
jgi:hypothetical protein